MVGRTLQLRRHEAVEQYIILRLRAEDIKRLDYLLKELRSGHISLPDGAPFSHADLADTVRTAFFGWFATLTDRHGHAVYAFNPLLTLFPQRRSQIIKVQVELEACTPALQQFRNNVAFHARSSLSAHFKARQALRHEDTYLDLVSAIQDFISLMSILAKEELESIPELLEELKKLRIDKHPAFRNVPAPMQDSQQ